MGLVGVILSVLFCQFMGYLWYSPLMFGPIWLRSTGRREAKGGHGAMVLLVPAVAKAVTALLLEYVQRHRLGVTTLEEAFQNGLVLSLFVALYDVTHAPFHGVGIPALLVNVGFNTVCTVVVALLVMAI